MPKMAIAITHLNIDDYYSAIELFLRSFFDASLGIRRQALVLEGSCVRIVYAKEPVCDGGNTVFSMNLEVTSSLQCDQVYHLAFDGPAFAIRRPIKPTGFTVANLDAFLG